MPTGFWDVENSNPFRNYLETEVDQSDLYHLWQVTYVSLVTIWRRSWFKIIIKDMLHDEYIIQAVAEKWYVDFNEFF